MNLVGPLNSGEVDSCLDAVSDQDSRTPVSGTVVGVYIDLNVACLSTPTITITTKGPPVETILEVATDTGGWFYPVTPIHLNTTGGAIANLYSGGVPIHDYVNVEISDANYGDDVDVYLLVE